MTTSTPEKLLHKNSLLTDVFRRHDQYKKLNALLRAELNKIFRLSASSEPEFNQLLQQIEVVNLQKNRLTIACANSALTTRLRFILPELIQRLRQANYLPNLLAIDLSVMSDASSPASKQNSVNEKQAKQIRKVLTQLKEK